jgi:hypothetical protein
MRDRVYYLEEPLCSNDAEIVSARVFDGRTLTQVRIPHVLPVLTNGPLTAAQHREHRQSLRKQLRSVGIAADKYTRIVLVATRDKYWYADLCFAVVTETRKYPWIVQTKRQGEGPGEARILDIDWQLVS